MGTDRARARRAPRPGVVLGLSRSLQSLMMQHPRPSMTPATILPASRRPGTRWSRSEPVILTPRARLLSIPRWWSGAQLANIRW
ncbi:hypothetical protein VDGL01_00402 [Verticillium dahliae]